MCDFWYEGNGVRIGRIKIRLFRKVIEDLFFLKRGLGGGGFFFLECRVGDRHQGPE